MKIKPTQLYDWDTEPVDERPSEFMSSASWSSLSGYQIAPQVVQRPAPPRFGFTRLLIAALVLLVLGALAIAKIAPLLRV